MHLTFVQKRVLSWCLLAVLAWWMLWSLAVVLTPFVIAAVLAYALSPVLECLQRCGGVRVPRAVWVLVVQAVLVLVLLGLAMLIVPILAHELPLMRAQLPVLIDRLDAYVTPWLQHWGLHLHLDLSSVRAWTLTYLSSNLEDVLSSLLQSLKLSGGFLLVLIGNLVLIPVALFYLLLDWNKIVDRVFELVPPRWHGPCDSFVQETNFVLGQYLRGQLLVMGLLAVFYSAGLALFGLDLALPIGVFTGLAVFVPYLGFGLGLVFALLAGLLEFASLKAVVMVATVYGLGQVIEGFFLTPRLVGQRIGLHPLAVIFALLALGQLLGFVGVLLALPLSAILLVTMRRLRASYMTSRLYKYQP